MTKRVLEYLTPKELVERLYNTKVGVDIYFTFDSKQEVEENDGEPEGWFGIKKLEIFDDYAPLVAIGFMGGGCTRVIDVYSETVLFEDATKEEWIVIVERFLKKYISLDHSDYFHGYLCVENESEEM